MSFSCWCWWNCQSNGRSKTLLATLEFNACWINLVDIIFMWMTPFWHDLRAIELFDSQALNLIKDWHSAKQFWRYPRTDVMHGMHWLDNVKWCFRWGTRQTCWCHLHHIEQGTPLSTLASPDPRCGRRSEHSACPFLLLCLLQVACESTSSSAIFR